MRRLIASLLSSILLAGISAPLALALSADPPHACCLRKRPHCHNSTATDSTELAFRAPSCAQHSCCRALSATHWAQPKSSATAHSVNQAKQIHWLSQETIPSANDTAAHAVRGPPDFSIA